jgi:hypothetical protein
MSLIRWTLEQRPIPRAANPYYASSWVIDSHPTGCSPAAGRTLQLALFQSLNRHGILNDLPEGTRSKLRLVREMYGIRIERKPGPRERLVTGLRVSSDPLQLPVS